MSVTPELRILRFHHSRQRAHQHAALASEIAVNLHLESCRKQKARTDGDAQSQRPFHRAAGCILMYGKAGVNTAAVYEIAPDTGA